MAKKAAGRAIVLAFTLVLAWGCASQALAAPLAVGDWFSERYQASGYMFFLEDGRILFMPRGTEDRGVSKALQCVDADGTLLWTHPLPMVSVHTKALRDGDGNIVLAVKAHDGPWRVLILGPEGALLWDEALPDNAYIPALAPDGVYYSILGADAQDMRLWKMDWLGERREIPIQPMRGVQPWIEAVVSGDDTFLPVLYRHPEGKPWVAMLCLDGQGGVRWHHSIGQTGWEPGVNPIAYTSIHSWIPNQAGGVTLVVTKHLGQGEKHTHVLCLDGNGQAIWTVELTLDGEGPEPTLSVLQQEENGNYTLWGDARVPVGGNAFITFELTLDVDGNFVSNEFKPLWGYCHRYLDGEVYAVVDPHSIEPGTPVLARFDDLPSIEMEDFIVTRR